MNLFGFPLAGQTRIRFESNNASVVGEVKIGGDWVTQEETRHQLERPLVGAPNYQQLAYVERIDKMLETESERVELLGMARDLQSPTTEPTTQASYTGVVEELPPDVDDHFKYAGQDNPRTAQIRRFKMDGTDIEVHLLLPDRGMYEPPDRDEGERRDAWRRIAFFNSETGQYVRQEVDGVWEPDIHTFEGRPVKAFQPQQETGMLPEYEYPSDPYSEDEAEHSQQFANYRAEVEGRYEQQWIDGEMRRVLVETGERQMHQAAQMWMRVEGASDSLIKQKVEDIYNNPQSWSEGDTQIC